MYTTVKKICKKLPGRTEGTQGNMMSGVRKVIPPQNGPLVPDERTTNSEAPPEVNIVDQSCLGDARSDFRSL